jgi:hypothetical protein
MSWHALAAGIHTAITADTGSGGLRNASAPLITAGYNVEGAQGATYPYLVYFPSVQQELDCYTSGDNVLIDFDFAIFVAPTAGPAALATIANRLRTVFHRQTVTALAGSGWTARALVRTGAIGPFFSEHTVQLNETYRAMLVS